MIFKNSNKMSFLTLMTFVMFIYISSSSINSYTTCNSTSYLESETLTCKQCPTNTYPNPNQVIPNECICQSGFYSADNNTCTQYVSGGCNSDQFVNAFNDDGSTNLGASSCITCHSDSYANQ